ncbi:MAG: AAA family ATPase [Candidatus Sericytochromatia bacterium]|nr:AAA family ATPase [Candidatus Sericytochromatia bacterium]
MEKRQAAPIAPMSLPLPPRYALIQPLGGGGYGRVWQVRDLEMGQDVAMKVPNLPDEGREAALLRFRREFRLMQLVRHPHCCEGLAFGELLDGRPFFTMELVEGPGLDGQAPLPGGRVRELMGQLLSALGAVHAQGYVHRDLKPANLRLTADGQLKLTDFGLAELAGRAGGPITGTLWYLAPEVIKRGPVDRRADLYALGAVAYELLAGEPPFVGGRAVDVLQAHLTAPVVPLTVRCPDLDPGLALVVRRLLEKDPLERFQNAFEALAALGFPIPDHFAESLLSSPLVGREQAQTLLTDRLNQVACGEAGATVLLHGPPGLGKSRLLEDLRSQAGIANVPVIRAASHEREGAPYATVVELLAAVWRALGPPEEDLAAVAPVLARLTPLPGVEPAPPLEAAGERRRLQAAVATLMEAHARRTGLLVLLDDWHWVEPLGRELLTNLMRVLAGVPVLFVLAGNYPPEGSDDWVAAVTAVPVMPLDEPAVGQVVAAMLGVAEPDPAFVARVAELTEGVPFVIAGLLEHLVTSGALAMRAGRWDTRVALSPGLVPRQLSALIVGKVDRLSPVPQRVARLLAVHGREAPAAWIAQAAALDDDGLLAALDELERRGILARDDGGAYGFVQPHFSDFLYANTAGDQLVALHQAVGRAIEAELVGLGPDGPQRTTGLAALAHHFQRAGDRERTARYALAAGLGHLGLQALAPADRLLKDAITALDEPGLSLAASERMSLRLQALHALARVRRGLGANHAARLLLAEALPLAAELGDRAAEAEVLADLAQVQRLLAAWDEALAAGERARALYAGLGDRVGVASASLHLSRTWLFTGQPAQAIALAEAALAEARATGEARLTAEALGHLGGLLLTYASGQAERGLRLLQEVIGLLPSLGDQGGLRDAHMLLGSAHQTMGDYGASARAYEQAQVLSEQLGAHAGVVAALANRALVALGVGDYHQAAQLSQAAYGRAMQMQNGYVLGIAQLVEALAAAHLGRPAEALPLLARAQALGAELSHRYLEVMARQGALELYLFVGDLAAAEGEAGSLVGLVDAGGGSDPALRLLAVRAELALRRDDEASAEALLAEALAAGTPAPGAHLRLLRARARLALHQEAWPLLRRLGVEGLVLSERLGVRPLVADMRSLLGEWALATGSPEATGHFRALLDVAEAMGAQVPRALALFGLAAARPYQPEAAGYAARAREVLLAAAVGLEPAAVEAFCEAPDRLRVAAGNYIAFSLPRTVVRGTGALLGLPSESW